jgi:hypothetical protein
MREAVEHTAMAFLAMTVKCARCHEHKYDPIAHTDYYRFRAFFEPYDVRTDPIDGSTASERDAGKTEIAKDGLSRVYDRQPTPPTFVFLRGDDRNPDAAHPLVPAVLPALGNAEITIAPVTLPLAGYYPALKPSVMSERLALAQANVAKARGSGDGLAQRAAAAELADLELRASAEKARLADPASLATKELARRAARAEREATLLRAQREHESAQRTLAAIKNPKGKTARKEAAAAERALAKAKSDLEAAKKPRADTDASYTPLGPTYPKSSTGRRTALARWIADARNPRTARVAVNHIWLRHFGAGLVKLPADFGVRGGTPSHREMLDWMAVELADSGWSMKHLHRLIVTSNTYRLASAGGRETDRRVDPENRFLWRANTRRMEAEAVRDSLLAVSNRLDRRVGGPEIPESQGETTLRRSLFFRCTPNESMEFLEQFDAPGPNECYERRPSVVPQQALALANSGLAQSCGQCIARELARVRDADEFVSAAFETVLSRRPTLAERQRCVRFLSEHRELLSSERKLTKFPAAPDDASPPSRELGQRVRENLVQVLLNHNDFVTIH